MPYQDIFDSRIYQLSEKISDEVWGIVMAWPPFVKDALGKQFVQAADSIGANIAESAGRFYPLDVIRFLHFARGSVRETQHWVKRSMQRRLISEAQSQELLTHLQEVLHMLNTYIKFQRTRKTPSVKQIKEPTALYSSENRVDSEDDNTLWQEP